MRSLQQMIRLHRWSLDEKQRKLSELEILRERLLNELDALDRLAVSESEAAGRSQEGAIAFSNYIAALLERKRKLQESLRELDWATDAAREALGEAFQEVKRYELAAENAAKRKDASRRKRESLVDDELGIEAFRRRSGVRA